MDADEWAEIAHEVVQAREQIAFLTAPSQRDNGLTLTDAYEVARHVEDQWAAAGHVSNGVKIGFTAPVKWAALEIGAPVWSRTYQDTTADANSGPVALDRFVAPRLEAEVVVKLAHDLGPGAGLTAAAQAIEWAALGFELVDCHIAGWKVRAADLVADFGAHAALVIGERLVLHPVALLELTELEVKLHCTNGFTAHGAGREVIGGPIQALATLLASPQAPSLPAGSIVSTGALTGGAHTITPGETWNLEPVSGPLSGLALALADG
jgi:2-keto-4-pentenoate hydratase